MREIIVTYDVFRQDYPDLCDKLIEEMVSSTGENMSLNDIMFFYYWAIYPIESFEEDISEIEETKQEMLFEERFEYELSKISMEVYIRYDTYIRGEIVDELNIPPIVQEQLIKILISTMTYEQTIYNNKEVIDSIPTDIETYKEIEDILSPSLSKSQINIKQEVDLDMDSILDKISKSGIDSLNETELSYLKKYSS